MNDPVGANLRDALLNPFLEFGPGGHKNMPEKRSAHLGKQVLHQIEPSPMLGRVHILKPIGTGAR